MNKLFSKTFVMGLYVVVFLSAAQLSHVYAQASSEASPSATPNSILEKIDALKREVASKAAALKQEVSKKMANKVLLGQIDVVTGNNFSLITKKGPKSVSVNEYTEYSSSAQPSSSNATTTASKKQTKTAPAKIALKDFEKGNFVVAMGDIDDKGVLNAKKVKKLNWEAQKLKQTIWGQVISTSGVAMDLRSKDEKTFSILFDENTVWNFGGKDGSSKDMEVGKSLAVIASYDGEKLLAKYVYLIPETGYFKKQKTASPSATAKSSVKPTATPKGKN